ncbi:hypothetical protein D3C71_2180510 [compost metagenome]
MVAHALDDDVHAAVAHREPLAGNAADISFTARRTIECRVSDNDVIFRFERRFIRRIDRDLASR